MSIGRKVKYRLYGRSKAWGTLRKMWRVKTMSMKAKKMLYKGEVIAAMTD